MGKPSSSCLKIIACGGDSPVEDGTNTQSPEAKRSGEKCGWGFLKRSAKHRVLSDNVTSKNLTEGAKDTPQQNSIGTETPTLPTTSEKVLALEQPIEKQQSPTSIELKPSKSVDLDPSEALDAPKKPESLGSGVLERVDVSEAPELIDPKTHMSTGETESLNPIEPEVPGIDATAPEKPESVDLKTCALAGESESLNLVESEEPEIEPTLAVDPPELVEPNTCVSVDESESLELIEPEVPETLTTSSLEPPEQAETKASKEIVSEPHVSTELKPLETQVSSQDDNLEEPLIITVQTGVRGFLAQRELVRLRSAIKLQAAMRGHLVRRQAVDTLYCMQGIIKVQNLVRAHSSKANDASVTKHATTKSSTEKLLTNAFARQLSKSMPKSKSTIIKCDPLNPNHAWTWLERWMDVSSSGLSDSKTPEILEEGPLMECEDLSQVLAESVNPEFTVEEASNAFEIEKGSISSKPTEEYPPSNILSSEEKMEQTHGSTDVSFGESLGSVAQNLSTELDSPSQPQSDPPSNYLIVETKEPELSTEKMAVEEMDAENKKFANGSRNASNPQFILAQSKFEDLSSAAGNNALSLEESVHKEEHPIPDETKTNIGGSESGTQLSVTSTLDSLDDQSEAEIVEMEVKAKSLEEGTDTLINGEDLKVASNGCSSAYVPNSSTFSHKEIPESNGVATDSNQPEQKSEAIAQDEHDNGEYTVMNMALDSTKVEQNPERSGSDLQVEAGTQIEQPSSKVSLEATPNANHVVITESQGTPSKHGSVKIKKNKVDKSASKKKHGSHSPSKKTIVTALQNSEVRSSGEKLHKDQQKSTKRRNSLGSTKYDNVDQEPQSTTSSSKTLPSYMQATESAKAKAHSPRSSQDVQDKDTNFIKKRHSLPGVGGRQGLPRVQSQATAQQSPPQ